MLANTVAAHAPVWRYLYTHALDDPFLGQLRASHFLEEPLLWADADGFGIQFTPAEEQLSDQMIGYWTNFAKTGNPNGDDLPLWPPYDATTENTIALDTPITVLAGYHRGQCQFLDTVPILYPYPWEQGSRPPALPQIPRPFR